jgi:RNA polymerase sigma-70 factor (ECF subfamily)
MEEQELIRRAQAGDATAFGELLDLYYDTIFRFAWKWCRDRVNAEDIAQLACIKLASSLAQYRFQAAFSSWLYRLVISCAQDWQRSLGEGMKETALLVHAEGLSHAEAGTILGVSESTISWRIHTIRRHMGKREARVTQSV